MLRSGRFRWTGLLAVVGTLAAMAATMVVAAPGGAASPENVYSTSFQPQCVIAPGILNVREKPAMELKFTGPESVAEGQSGIEFTNASLTLTEPPEQFESFIALGIHKVTGKLTNLVVDATNMQPKELNIARPGPLPEGVPYENLVKGTATTIIIPGSGGFSFGPYSVTGKAGEEATLSLDPKPGFEEIPEEGPKATGQGIVLSIEGFNEKGEHIVGPLTLNCTAPPSVTLARMAITKTEITTDTTSLPSSSTTQCLPCELCPTNPECPPRPNIRSVTPSEAPATGGTHVSIQGEHFERNDTVLFGSSSPISVLFVSEHEFQVISPPGSGSVEVVVENAPFWRATGGPFRYTVEHPIEEAVYQNSALSGSITDGKLGQPITLPTGSTFSGSALFNQVSRQGFIKGDVSIPPFSTSFKLLGVLPASLGMTLTQSGAIEGTISEPVAETPAHMTVHLPMKLNLGITSFKLLGLSVPTSCSTSEPISLNLLASPIGGPERVGQGLQFSGETTVPKVKCAGGVLGSLFGSVLSSLLSGGEDPYTVLIAPGLAGGPPEPGGSG